ncbi:hypothetical protein QGP82_25220 [Leptothoe sp. LEGE 181152]|uniref:Uncharacterized protein n=1 Tax=Adonisia turfae CCMR0081 TaxID=2292702 RepID=A0A6M0RLG8_9CYAN|nr:hypothetical protein [Adonisia turfae]MDV3352007.1 hypothetical protein [Leptothoe sp. LEGE 181152]NEZ56511.1 hypothetical protein [Adonisia turfae CCMR0081]
MKLNHHLGAQLTQYLLIACASSAIVQLSALWPPLKFSLLAVGVAAFFVVVSLLSLQLNGITRGHPWAKRLTFEASSVGILQFIAFVSAITLGGIVTWIAIF